MGESCKIIGGLKQGWISQGWQTFLAFLDFFPRRTERDFLILKKVIQEMDQKRSEVIITLPRSSTKTSLMVSSVAFDTERTSAEIQAWSLSSNQTRVPLLYMFSAMFTAKVTACPARGWGGRGCWSLLFSG
jgi:hypothetical protein